MKFLDLVINIFWGILLSKGQAADEKSTHQSTNFSLILNTQPRIGISSSIPGSARLMMRSGESLNMTCRIAGLRDPLSVEITHYWNTPESTKGVIDITTIRGGDGQLLFLSIPKLYPGHSGEYSCFATVGESSQVSKLHLAVRPKYNYRNSCGGEKWFRCHSDECIGSRFVCDGKPDCPDESDESPRVCGENPCYGKLLCDDGRCLSWSLCCDSDTDPNCTAIERISCCMNAFHAEIERAIVIQQHQQNGTDGGLLNSATYMVLGSMVAFVFVATTLIIAVVRVHTKRRISSISAARRRVLRGRLSDFDIDAYLDSRCFEDQLQSARYMRVTYNINNGVQFVGRPVAPPPYSECGIPGPRNEPPPPYISVENLNCGESRYGKTEIPELEPLNPEQFGATVEQSGTGSMPLR